MKITHAFLLLGLYSFLLISCGNIQNKSKQKALDMITIRTLGLAYLEENKLEEAEAEFLKLIDIAPKEKLGYANLGLVYLRMGKYQEAEERIRKAIRIEPKDPDIRLILAKVHQMNSDRESSISELKESLRISPGHIKTLYNLYLYIIYVQVLKYLFVYHSSSQET